MNRSNPPLRRFIAVLAMMIGTLSYAADWPSKPLRVIVPAAAGSPPDIIARVLTDSLGRRWNAQFVVENKAGASGVIGMNAVKAAAPDNHVFILAQAATVAVTPHVNASAQYDVDNDLVPAALVGTGPLMVVTKTSNTSSSLTEFLQRAAASDKTVNVAVTGNYSLPYLTAELIKRKTKAKLNVVPFSSSGSALTAVVSGDADLLIDGIPSVESMLKSDRVKALAVTSAKRLATYPEIATLADTVPGLEVEGWFVLFGKRPTAQFVIENFNKDTNLALQDKHLADKLMELGVIARPLPLDQVQSFVDRERKRWGSLIAELGIKPQ
jgi:tripartite-type tricarboxylate transporter receptor subunit TctC